MRRSGVRVKTTERQFMSEQSPILLIDGSPLTTRAVIEVARTGRQVKLTEDAMTNLAEARHIVDEVVAQETLDKMKAWKKYKFDAMFVGSDWKGTDAWNGFEKQFKEVGVDIVYFQYTHRTSSTKLRKVLDILTQSR